MSRSPRSRIKSPIQRCYALSDNEGSIHPDLSEESFDRVLDTIWNKLENTPMGQRKRKTDIKRNMFWFEGLFSQTMNALTDDGGTPATWKHDALMATYDTWCEYLDAYVFNLDIN